MPVDCPGVLRELSSRSRAPALSGLASPLLAAQLIAILTAPLGAATRVGSEFQVNTYTSTTQSSPAVAVASDGRFVVVWQSFDQDAAASFGVFGQRFDTAGTAVGTEFPINNVTGGNQFNPKVAIDDEGNFVVVWGGYSPEDNDYGVFARRFDSSGSALGVQFRVNSYTVNTQYHPVVAMDDDGDFVVVWSSYQDNLGLFSGLGIFAQRFASGGGAVAAEFEVNVYRTQAQSRPAVAADADGDFVVTWHSHTQDGPSAKGTFGRQFSSSGVALASEFQVNTYSISDQRYPSAGMDGDGDFLIAWESFQDGSSTGVFGQRFASSGARVGVELQINAWTTEDQRVAAVAGDGNGDFVVAWQSRFGQDGNGGGIFGRLVSISNGLVGSEFQVNSYTTDYQVGPAVAMDALGDFVVAWQSKYQDGASNYGVFGQRFGVPPLTESDIDGDGQGEALTDGLLFLRHAFGFTGTTLTAGVVDPQYCLRCTGASITSHLGSLGLQLDVDDDGEIRALTDGLLMLRFLFGFTGNTLINGAVDPDCSRCTAEDIVTYLTGLVG